MARGSGTGLARLLGRSRPLARGLGMIAHQAVIRSAERGVSRVPIRVVRHSTAWNCQACRRSDRMPTRATRRSSPDALSAAGGGSGEGAPRQSRSRRCGTWSARRPARPVGATRGDDRSGAPLRGPRPLRTVWWQLGGTDRWSDRPRRRPSRRPSSTSTPRRPGRLAWPAARMPRRPSGWHAEVGGRGPLAGSPRWPGEEVAPGRRPTTLEARHTDVR